MWTDTEGRTLQKNPVRCRFWRHVASPKAMQLGPPWPSVSEENVRGANNTSALIIVDHKR